MTIGSLLKEKRIEKGWSQSELSYRTRITQKQISNIEMGHSNPRTATLEILARELGIELPWMEVRTDTDAMRRLFRSRSPDHPHAA